VASSEYLQEDVGLSGRLFILLGQPPVSDVWWWFFSWVIRQPGVVIIGRDAGKLGGGTGFPGDGGNNGVRRTVGSSAL
jgi:hypothetical protein